MKNNVLKYFLIACATAMVIPSGIIGCGHKNQDAHEISKEQEKDKEKDKDKDKDKDKYKEEKSDSSESAEDSTKEKSKLALENGRNLLFGLNGEEIDYEAAFQIFTEIEPEVDYEYLGEINYYIGHMYELGLGVVEDNETAYDYLYKAYVWECPKAAYALGTMYYYGEGVEKDKEKAKDYFTAAVEGGCIEANEGLADFAYDEGDYETECKLLEEAIENGTEPDLIAMNMLHLSEMYECGDYVDQDYDKAYELIEQAADLGYNKAYYELGCVYRNGKLGKDYDGNKAEKYYEKAVDLDYTEAMYTLGSWYFNTPGNYKNTAFEYFLMAAERNHAESGYYVGYLYQYGQDYGMTQDMDMAVAWYRKSSELGYSYSTNKLGLIYDWMGDYYTAYDYYTLALEQDPNNNSFKYNVALMTWNGYGDGNINYAKSLVESAAAEGHELSQQLLDIMINNGV